MSVIVGLTANFNIVPICYVYLTANESVASRSRVLQFVRKHFPAFSFATIISDRDKGKAGAIAHVFCASDFESAEVSEDTWSVHSAPQSTKELSDRRSTWTGGQTILLQEAQKGKFGKAHRGINKLYDKMVHARSIAEIAEFRRSQEWRQLTQAGTDAIDDVPRSADEVQFLAA